MAKLMFFISAIALLASNVLLTVASPLAAAGLATAVITRVGPITPGGPNVTLTGTAESIYNQILKLNPSYDPEEHGGTRLPSRPPIDPNTEPNTGTSLVPARVVKRQLENRTPTSGCCRCLGAPYNGEIVGIGAIVAGRDYLDGLGSAWCGTDSGGVSRISCSYNSAIYLVNSVRAATGASCVYLGSLVQRVLLSCTYWPIPLEGETDWEIIYIAWGIARINGQMCDSAGYCVIVSTAKC
ncbi:hypothetical protein V495_02494 [Pseudogymnoascus sp. VKM F-4514 (FW-929)]|nr:hypothetical protein V495_02494 [Pseudogymnoascus sp. VKM F-4514 (FW-929)]KFY59828.1 hypothetical protein V497_04057 [Pseudogymnoascus sp. VKM F-4516 (FW-969)]